MENSNREPNSKPEIQMWPEMTPRNGLAGNILRFAEVKPRIPQTLVEIVNRK